MYLDSLKCGHFAQKRHCDSPNIALIYAHAKGNRGADLIRGVEDDGMGCRPKTYDIYTLGPISTFLPLLQRLIKNYRSVWYQKRNLKKKMLILRRT